MKKYRILLGLSLLIGFFGTSLNGCAVSQKIKAKTGAELWGENCNRCHNAPGPGEFNNANWDIIAMHMRVRANLTETETNKIIDFLKSANN